jgi:protein TonB
MKTQTENVQRWDDIIFENRNKDYGAYAIRKDYDDRVLMGWSISLGVIVIIFFSSFFSLEQPGVTAIQVSGCGGLILPPKVIPTVAPKEAAPAPKVPNKNLPPVVSKKPDAPVDPAKPVDPADPNGGQGAGTPAGNAGSGTGNIEIPLATPPAPPYVLAPEVMPAFEGGMEGMMKFLQKKLRYPRRAQERKEEGTVFVSFIIDPQGEVTDVELVKGFFPDCDKEAMRVISLMNKWKPGMQNKMPVAVKMVLPIKFKLDN